MALTQRLEIRQGQSLVMTPQLQQAIKLLQLSNLELAEYVEGELERNPLLERDEREPVSDEREAVAEKSTDGETLDAALSREDFSKAEDMDAERDDVYAESDHTVPPQSQPLADWTTLKSAPAHDGGENALEGTLTQAATLKDHLLDQLSIAGLSPDRRLIAASLIDGIDEAGYLRGDLDEMARAPWRAARHSR